MAGGGGQGILPERIGLLQSDFDGPVVDLFDGVNTGVHPAQVRGCLWVTRPLHAEDHIIQRHRAAILKGDPLAHGVAVGQRIGILPAFGQPWCQGFAIGQRQ